MADFEPDSTQVPPQIIEKPTSVTVFGVLNIVFGGLGLLFSVFSILLLIGIGVKMLIEYQRLADKTEMSGSFIYYLWNLLAIVVICGFSVWTLLLGIALVKFRKWARRGAIIFAWVLIVLGGMTNIMYFFSSWHSPVSGKLFAVIGIIFNALIYLPYPVLILIFMQTAKVKQAFSAIEGKK
jgi:hypothetical protein